VDNDTVEDELRERIQELEDELQKLKDQKQQDGTDSAAVDEEIEEVHDQIRDEADHSGMSRRRFMKAIASGAAGLGAAAMMPSAAALDIESNNPLSYNGNLSVGTQGDLNLQGDDLSNVGSIASQTVTTESLNDASIARDGTELENLASNISNNDTIWLEPNKTYNIDDTLELSNASNWSIRSMGGKSRNGPIIRPTGDFPHVKIKASGPTDQSTWINGWSIEGVWFSPGNQTSADGLVINGAKFAQIERCVVQAGGTPLKVGEPASGSGVDRASEFYVNGSLINSDSARNVYLGTASVKFDQTEIFGTADVGIEMEDCRNAHMIMGSFGNQNTYIQVKSPNRDSYGPHLFGIRAENLGSGPWIEYDGTGSGSIEHSTHFGTRFRHLDGTAVKVRGNVDGVAFSNCLWVQADGIGTAIDTGSGEPIGDIWVPPNQTLRGDSFPVNDPDEHINYGWDFGAAPNEWENVSGEIYHSALHTANGWFFRAPSDLDRVQLWDDSNTKLVSFDVSGDIKLLRDGQGIVVKRPDGSASDRIRVDNNGNITVDNDI